MMARVIEGTLDPGLADYTNYITQTRTEAQELFDGCGHDDTIRVWSVGCATGEEAYSLTILMLEEAARRDIRPHIQIFASDLNEAALAIAREGRYPRAIEADMSEERYRPCWKMPPEKNRRWEATLKLQMYHRVRIWIENSASLRKRSGWPVVPPDETPESEPVAQVTARKVADASKRGFEAGAEIFKFSAVGTIRADCTVCGAALLDVIRLTCSAFGRSGV